MNDKVSVKLEGIYAGEGYLKPHHLFTDVFIYENGIKKPFRDQHCWLNAVWGNWPEGLKHGDRVTFWASTHPRRGGCKITEARQIEIVEEGKE